MYIYVRAYVHTCSLVSSPDRLCSSWSGDEASVVSCPDGWGLYVGTAAAMMAKHSTPSDEALPTEGGSQLESSKRRKLAYCGAAKYNTITVSSRASGLIVIQSNLCGMISTLLCSLQ